MDDVKVHYNSDKPAQLSALAYAQGTDIHVAPGQEKHLPHEAWHVVQQKQGRVQPTIQMQGVNVNDNEGLEKEADMMGGKASIIDFSVSQLKIPPSVNVTTDSIIQLVNICKEGTEEVLIDTDMLPQGYFRGVVIRRIIGKENAAYVVRQLRAINTSETNVFADEIEKQFSPEELEKQKKINEQKQKEKKEIDNGLEIRGLLHRVHAREEGVWKHWMEPEEELECIPDAHKKMVPKDSSSKAKVYHMQYTSYEDSFGWDMILSMLKIASHEFFLLVISVCTGDVEELESKIRVNVPENAEVVYEIVSVRLNSDSFSEWAEDSGEFFKDGTVGAPRHLRQSSLEKPMLSDRDKRGVPKPQTQWRFPTGEIDENPASLVGDQVYIKDKYKEKLSIAGATGKTFVNLRSYFEGGNLLAGTDMRGKPYVLVGKDVISATCYLLEAEINDERYVRNLISQELEVLPDDILFVEQPGCFHLDMGMVLLGKGTVIVNDSRIVLEVMKGWMLQDYEIVQSKISELSMHLSEVKEIFQNIEKYLTDILTEQALYEDLTIKDLLAWNERLRIERIPANFPETIFNPPMNFLNGETGTGPDGRSFFITNGGDARAENFISNYYFKLLSGSQLARIYFVHSEASSESLKKGGGIGCRTKTAYI